MTRKRELVNDSASHRQRTSGPQESTVAGLPGLTFEVTDWDSVKLLSGYLRLRA